MEKRSKVERCFAEAMTSCAAQGICLEQQISAKELTRKERQRNGIEQRSDAWAWYSGVMPWKGEEQKRTGIASKSKD